MWKTHFVFYYSTQWRVLCSYAKIIGSFLFWILDANYKEFIVNSNAWLLLCQTKNKIYCNQLRNIRIKRYIFLGFVVAFARFFIIRINCVTPTSQPKVYDVSASMQRVLILLKSKITHEIAGQRVGYFFAACQSKEGFKRERAEIFPAHATVYYFGSATYINPVI